MAEHLHRIRVDGWKRRKNNYAKTGTTKRGKTIRVHLVREDKILRKEISFYILKQKRIRVGGLVYEEALKFRVPCLLIFYNKLCSGILRTCSFSNILIQALSTTTIM